MKIILVSLFMSYLIIGTLGSSSVDCNYNSNYDFYAVGIKYRCEVSNNLNISSPESAQIDAVNGVYRSGKSNNDEIYFHARDKHIEYFPRGLEKFFSNLTGIAIWRSQLKEIHQDDLKPYTKLKYLNLASNNIEVIEDKLFDFQPDIEVIIFEDCKIFHISSTVFDNLSKLTTLDFETNNCTNNFTKNNREGVLEVIKNVKSTCISSDYVKLDEKLKNLEDNYLNLRYNATFNEIVNNFELELAKSKFAGIRSLKERVFKISDWTELNHKIETQNSKITAMTNKMDNIENILSEMMKSQNTTATDKTETTKTTEIQIPWIIIATAIVGFIQTIILVVIYKQFFV